MATQEKLDIKLKQLRIAVERTKTATDSNSQEAIERQLVTLKSISDSVNQIRVDVEELKIESEEEMAIITTWNVDLDSKLSEADMAMMQLRQWLEQRKREQEIAAREDQFGFEAKLHQTRMKFETELASVKIKNDLATNDNETTIGSQSTMAKLPKLVISKFSGNYQDWQRFWGQFTETIDKTYIAPITKFTYLCELLDPKIKHVVDSLPFTPEGYNRAKAILQEQYGKESEIIKSYVKEILDLPYIPSANPRKIGEFSERLNHCVQALQTMNKISQVDGNVAMTLDKLPAIRGDLAMTDPNWEKWNFAQLSEAIRLWTRRNPVDPNRHDREKPEKERFTRSFYTKPRECVYCGDANHKATNCNKVTDVSQRKQILAKKRLCFNCAIGKHRAAECSSKTTCQNCERRHHTSICNSTKVKEKEHVLTTNQSSEGVFPVIVIKVNGIKCRALIDSGSGSSYISATLINMLKTKPVTIQTKLVEMLMSSKQVRMETFDLNAESVDGHFEMPAKFIKVNKSELLTVANPHYADIICENAHLSGVEINDNDEKSQLPVHVILGNGEYARIKTKTKPHVGNDGEPVAELTKMGWFIMSPGAEFNRQSMLLTQTSQSDYENLCRMDVLGLADVAENDQNVVHAEFKEQLSRANEGWYETGLPWRGNHPELPHNKQGSLQRLQSLTKGLHRKGLSSDYNDVIQNQIAENIVERAPEEISGREYYIPHKAVVRETAETTKLRIVYDASARASPESPSLNECLNPGPPLQNRLLDVLIRQRAYPIVVTGDIRQAFLQIRIRENERDALRFHWRSSEDDEVETYRFTRALFGLVSSPFLLNGVLEAHLDAWEKRSPLIVAELRKALYVDDLLTGGTSVEEVQEIKQGAIEIMQDATFQLHKWNSNLQELEDDKPLQNIEEQTYAKEQLNVKHEETKMLGLKWDKQQDTLAVVIPTEESAPTKRGILGKLARIYDPLGTISPLTLIGKQIYRKVCEKGVPWDTTLTGELLQRWRKWEQKLATEIKIPRAITQYQEEIEEVELHAYGDASKEGVGAVVYSIVRQRSGTTQRLVAAKSRLAKQGLTIPRLELVAAHMATNLLVNVRNALDNIPAPKLYGWMDSTVALYWIKGNGQYKQFVANRVGKIQLQREIQWRYVPTSENPADLASRGGQVQPTSLWHNGPKWLQDKEKWPANLVLKSSPVSEVEAKQIREVLNVAKCTQHPDAFDKLLERNSLRRTLRVGARIRRFIRNRRNQRKQHGPLTWEEIQEERDWWIRRVQERESKELHYSKFKAQLDLRPNAENQMICHGRIQGQRPVYLPRNAQFTRKLVEQVHCETLHGGVGITMAAIREKFWVPKLRSLVKSVRSNCHGCKRFRATPIATPAPGFLPEDRTNIGTAFEVIGTDFAGPIRYKQTKVKEGKAYLVIFACSLSRAVHLELLASLATELFIPTLKRLIARRGRPRVIYSDNGGTFVKAAKWISQIRYDERLQGFLEESEITWKFNLSRAPWWGGQFERLIAVVKQAMYKVVGGATLTWSELSEVLLDLETQINRRPLSYVEDDPELPTLTPATFLYQRSTQLPEEEAWRIKDICLRKRARYLKSCKDGLWRRWKREYLTALRERHNLTHKVSKFQPREGDVVIVKADNKNRGTWPLAVVSETYTGKDGVIRGVELKTANGKLERPVQLIYPLELACDTKPKQNEPSLNPEAQTFRPKRDAAAAASLRIEQVQDIEQ